MKHMTTGRSPWVPDPRAFPGVAAHLRACGTFGEDFDGLLAAITGTVS
jgi:hypothetical protein